ncbi:MAG: hypothetical protein LUQ01_02385 [Methanolinea sp.]|nr:hypothetical protein [Methanolinea sp.]
MIKKRTILEWILMAGILGTAALSSGCLSSVTMTGPDAGATVSGSALKVNLLGQDTDWTISRGCLWTVTFQVVNSGTAEEKNVNLHVEMVNADTGAVRDTKTVFLGTIVPGSEKTVTVELDGDCLEEYTVRAIASMG